MKKIKYYNKKNINKDNIIKYNQIIDFLNNSIEDNWGDIYKLGYETFGILLVGFCEWIHKNKEINGIETVYFLARDGYIVKKVYNILYPDEKTEYMYISRRSLSLPSIYLSKNIDDILSCMVLPPMFDIITFLDNIDVNLDEVKDELEKANIQINELFKRSELKQNDKIRKFIELIENKIRDKAEKKYNNFIQYLNELNFYGNIAVVDIGWHNSIQKNLINIIGERKVNVHGYYLGVYEDANRIELPHSADGYLYSYDIEKNRQIQTFAFVSLLESIFLAQEGTTISYEEENGKVIPKIAKYEYDNNKDMVEIIKQYQEGAIKFATNYIEEAKKIENITADIASAGIIKFGCSPLKKDLQVFETINFENYKINNIVNFQKGTIYYLLHPKKMIQDFYQSGWRIIFLKKLFKIPLPYYTIFKLICAIFSRG